MFVWKRQKVDEKEAADCPFKTYWILKHDWRICFCLLDKLENWYSFACSKISKDIRNSKFKAKIAEAKNRFGNNWVDKYFRNWHLEKAHPKLQFSKPNRLKFLKIHSKLALCRYRMPQDHDQCDQIWLFWKVLATNFTQKLSNFWALLKNITF